MFKRLNQKITEKTGRGTKTNYEPEFVKSQQYIEELKEGVEKLIKNIKTNVNSLGNSNLNHPEQLSEASNQMVAKIKLNEHGAGSSCATQLDTLIEVEKKIGARSRELQKRTADEVIHPMEEFISKNYASYKKQREVLEKRRLDMDASSNANRKSGSGPSEAHTTLFNEQKTAVKALMDEIPQWQETIANALKTWVEINAAYHSGCATDCTPE